MAVARTHSLELPSVLRSYELEGSVLGLLREEPLPDLSKLEPTGDMYRDGDSLGHITRFMDGLPPATRSTYVRLLCERFDIYPTRAQRY